MFALALIALALSGCPHDPDLTGRLTYLRGAAEHILTLGTCTDRRVGRAQPRTSIPGVTTAPARAAVQWIRVRGRTVFSRRENGPIVPLGLSPDGRWLVFAVDPMSSASIMADGLELQILATHGGSVRPLGLALAYPDYLTWCGGGLVYVRGGDRIATDVKQLSFATPPLWRPRSLWPDRHRSFASPVCDPSGDGVAVLTQRSSTDARFFATRWQLWSVTLAGAHRLLDDPPRGYADESPAYSPSGDALAFVRQRNGYGTLVVLHRGLHRLASLGYRLGFYGHHDWGVRWLP